MKQFLIVSYAVHKQKNGLIFSYAPYVREMNLWLKHVDKVRVVAPLINGDPDPLDMAYVHPQLEFIPIPNLDFTSVASAVKSLCYIPVIFLILFREMGITRHIHLRCPGNVGLLGLVVQMFFPRKYKTVKYANNCDPRSQQPFSYRIQKTILRNQCLSQKMKVLVYGEWNEKSKNIVPFYTASYTKVDRQEISIRELNPKVPLQLLFVGTLTPNKRPHTAIKTVSALKRSGIDAHLTLIGDGFQYQSLMDLSRNEGISDRILFTGKLSPADVVAHFNQSHFLIFMSWSEGWPKVVAEAMWWGCVPVSTDVSCVKTMVGDGARGLIISPDADEVAQAIVKLLNHPSRYAEMARNGMEWARQYHLERFEHDVSHMLHF